MNTQHAGSHLSPPLKGVHIPVVTQRTYRYCASVRLYLSLSKSSSAAAVFSGRLYACFNSCDKKTNNSRQREFIFTFIFEWPTTWALISSSCTGFRVLDKCKDFLPATFNHHGLSALSFPTSSGKIKFPVNNVHFSETTQFTPGCAEANTALLNKHCRKMFSFLSLQTSDTAAMQPSGVCTRIMTARNKKRGFGTISNPERFLNQDFQQIRQFCQIKNCRYIDSTFPPDRWSIGPGVLRPEELNMVEWKRPYVSVIMAVSGRCDLTLWLALSSTCMKYASSFNSAAMMINWWTS